MGNLDYINEIGASEDQAVSDTEAEANNTEIEESNEDFVQDSEESTSENIDSDTETVDEGELVALKKQIAGMEKRIADKDDYINELREASKQKEVQEQSVDTNEVEDDFWDNPEEKYRSLQEQIRIQNLQIQETVYANTVDNYWKTVNPDALREAVATDTEFANKFNSSGEPYKLAYEYLTNKASTKQKAHQSEIDAAVEAKLKELGVKQKEKREVPPSINTGGKSSSSTGKEAPDDGFAAVFGSRY